MLIFQVNVSFNMLIGFMLIKKECILQLMRHLPTYKVKLTEVYIYKERYEKVDEQFQLY